MADGRQPVDDGSGTQHTGLAAGRVQRMTNSTTVAPSASDSSDLEHTQAERTVATTQETGVPLSRLGGDNGSSLSEDLKPTTFARSASITSQTTLAPMADGPTLTIETATSTPRIYPTGRQNKETDNRTAMAGKSSKDKFNYASFDCGALVLAHNPEATSATAILLNNKDQYMLNKCSATKYVVVEICEDILVDTVMLANYEFFSSMFKDFRVYVSDRYPPKQHGWKLLGNFTARNVRDAQVFKVENPFIWARYLRVEFVSHYGHEYYCPLTLLKVYGTTMVEEIKAEEERGVYLPADKDTEGVPAVSPSYSIDSLAPTTRTLDILPGVPSISLDNLVKYPSVSPATTPPASMRPSTDEIRGIGTAMSGVSPPTSSTDRFMAASEASDITTSETANRPSAGHDTTSTESGPLWPTGSRATGQSADVNLPGLLHPPPSGGTQDSIFKTITKRLSILEHNASVSYKYLEEQSKALNQLFTQLEHAEKDKVAALLENCNRQLARMFGDLNREYRRTWGSLLRELEDQKSVSDKKLAELSQAVDRMNNQMVRQILLQSLLILALIGGKSLVKRVVSHLRNPTGFLEHPPSVQSASPRQPAIDVASVPTISVETANLEESSRPIDPTPALSLQQRAAEKKRRKKRRATIAVPINQADDSVVHQNVNVQMGQGRRASLSPSLLRHSANYPS
ncbi:hypothetical protein HK104_001760 [Borealophlyctis nickersoniae]|nr:hypothetical protein HK104_001760 [Borealophlyctis nickersoniae]